MSLQYYYLRPSVGHLFSDFDDGFFGWPLAPRRQQRRRLRPATFFHDVFPTVEDLWGALDFESAEQQPKTAADDAPTSVPGKSNEQSTATEATTTGAAPVPSSDTILAPASAATEAAPAETKAAAAATPESSSVAPAPAAAVSSWRGKLEPVLLRGIHWNILEKEAEFEVKADLPGLAKDDIKLTVHDGVLTLRAEQKLESKEENAKFRRVERAYGHVQRSLRLPRGVQASQVAAKHDNGMLVISFPRPPAADEATLSQPQTIQIA